MIEKYLIDFDILLVFNNFKPDINHITSLHYLMSQTQSVLKLLDDPINVLMDY